MSQALMSSFDHLVGPDRDPLLAAAAALTAHAVNDPRGGALVIIIRPHTSHHQVLSGGGSGALRAAVSVAASGTDRLWHDAPNGGTTETAVRTLPEVLRAAAEASRITTVHIGRVDSGSHVACVALWFETPDGVASMSDRATALAVLEAAAEKLAVVERAQGASATSTTIIDPTSDEAADRVFDKDDPNLDPVTGVAHAERFTTVLEQYENDEANLLVIDVDDFDSIAPDAVDDVLRTIADRLVAKTRGTDVVGRIGAHSFGVLFGNIDRSEAFHVAKRLSTVIREPIGSQSLTATIALAQQSGIIDMEELRELADEAIASGKRAGTGRLVMAA